MSTDETVSFSLEVNVAPAYEEIRRLQTVLYRTLGLIRRISGDDDLNTLIDYTMRAITMMNTLRLVVAAFYAASGPIGWAMFGVAAATSLITTGEFFGDWAYNVQRGHY